MPFHTASFWGTVIWQIKSAVPLIDGPTRLEKKYRQVILDRVSDCNLAIGTGMTQATTGGDRRSSNKPETP